MNRIQYIKGMLLVSFLFILGCQDYHFEVINPITLEYGQSISTNIEDYIDKESCLHHYEKIIKDARIELSDSLTSNNLYQEVGDYHVSITYKNIKKDIHVNIVDRTSPEFLKFEDEIKISVGDKIDYSKFYEVYDLSPFEVYIDDKDVNYKKSGVYKVKIKASDIYHNETTKEVNLYIDDVDKVNTQKQHMIYSIDIPTYNQKKEGYPLGCEGVSLYMALKGKGYLNDMSLKRFMESMPLSYNDNPENGYVGDPTKSRKSKMNIGKRTTIHPYPLTLWASSYGKAINMQGASIEDIKKEIKNKNPVIVWVTSGWNEPIFKTYSWGRTVSNNHATCVVGYDENQGRFLINDCSSARNGEYWVFEDVFENCYNARKYAVVIK